MHYSKLKTQQPVKTFKPMTRPDFFYFLHYSLYNRDTAQVLIFSHFPLKQGHETRIKVARRTTELSLIMPSTSSQTKLVVPIFIAVVYPFIIASTNCDYIL